MKPNPRAILLCGLVLWQLLDGQCLTARADKTLEAGVTTTRYLPPAMYGEWSITATLLETNAPNYFRREIHDIWILAREGNDVTVTNPANGASATVNVDQVQNNTASFHRMVRDPHEGIFIESPTITVNGNTLTGSTVNEMAVVKNGIPHVLYRAKYHLFAQRIGGARVEFAPMPQPPKFEIEELQMTPLNGTGKRY